MLVRQQELALLDVWVCRGVRRFQGLVVCATSHVEHICLVVTADAARFPDLDTLMDGVVQNWRALVDGPVHEGVPA